MIKTNWAHRIKNGLRWRYLHFKEFIKPWLALTDIKLRTVLPLRQKPHALPAELIVSLTSYPPRYATLLPTLQCLLSQTIKADRTILWLSHDDIHQLPEEIRALVKNGLEIRTTHSLGSYTKIIPTLNQFPDAFIITADDDLYYRSNWVEDLVSSWNGSKNEIVCHRAHQIKFDEAGLPISYARWDLDIESHANSADIFPTSGAGILYPPGSLSREVLNEANLTTLCPNADDVWLYWMGRKAGSRYKKSSGRHKIIMWPGSQDVALVNENLFEHGNDKKIKNMIGHYGWFQE
jgi:hypothetical protein